MRLHVVSKIQLNPCSRIFLTYLAISIMIVTVCSSENGTTTMEDVKEDEDAKEEELSTQFSLESLKNVTDELQDKFQELEREQAEFSEQVNDKLARMENRLDWLEEIANESLNTGLSSLHRKHQAELKDLREMHDNLANSVSKVYHHVHHLTKMHNISARLERTAQLVVQEKFNEASLHWTFLERHTFDEDLLMDYLDSVIVLAYGRNKSHLIPIFKFVHKLSYKEYKVYAYETLIYQILNSPQNLWDGSEIFILAHYIRKNYGVNSKGNSILPPLAKAVVSGLNVKLIYFQNYIPPTPSTTPLPTTPAPKKGGHGSGGGGHYVVKKIDQEAQDLAEEGGLEVHIRGDVIQSKYDKPKSFKYPVYGSKYKTYNESYAGMWQFIYQDNGFWIAKNGLNEGYLNVPAGEGDALNTVAMLDKDKDHLEFKFIWQDGKSVIIENAAFPGRPLQAVRMEWEEEEEREGKKRRGSRDVSFKVGDPEESSTGQAARFTVLA